MLFSEKCLDPIQNGIREVLEVEASTFERKYIGLPTPDSRIKEDNFIEYGKVHEKMHQRVGQTYVEVHVKSIVQALPTFTMVLFKVSMGFYDKYERLIRDLYWGDEWDNMTKPRRGGGISLRDMHLFNQALLVRNGWRLIHHPDSLCARVLKSNTTLKENY